MEEGEGGKEERCQRQRRPNSQTLSFRHKRTLSTKRGPPQSQHPFCFSFFKVLVLFCFSFVPLRRSWSSACRQEKERCYRLPLGMPGTAHGMGGWGGSWGGWNSHNSFQHYASLPPPPVPFHSERCCVHVLFIAFTSCEHTNAKKS